MQRVSPPCLSWLLPAVLLAGCSGERTGMEAMAIIGGEPSVRMATAQTVKPATTICSASVIAPRVIVTAKHCLGPDREDPGVFDGFEIWTRRVLDAAYHYKVIAGRTTTGNDVTEDVAVMVVDRDFDLMGASPYAVRRDVSGFVPGESARLVGWGDDGTGKAGVRRETVDKVTAADDQYIDTMGLGACKGDSGGSVLDLEDRLVGIMIEADCAGYTRSERIDHYLELVDWALETSGVCVSREEICGNAKDDDCDGFVDDGCAAEGDPCAEARACAKGLVCAAGEGGARCATPCDPKVDNACGAGRDCDAATNSCRSGTPAGCALVGPAGGSTATAPWAGLVALLLWRLIAGAGRAASRGRRPR